MVWQPSECDFWEPRGLRLHVLGARGLWLLPADSRKVTGGRRGARWSSRGERGPDGVAARRSPGEGPRGGRQEMAGAERIVRGPDH